MTEPILQHEVLVDILTVLQRIEAKLHGHEERFQKLEQSQAGSSTSLDSKEHCNQHDGVTGLSGVADRTEIGAAPLPRTGTHTDEDANLDETVQLIPYSQWSINNLGYCSIPSFSKDLEERLGDWRWMPDDDRLPLNSFLSKFSIPLHQPYIDFFTAGHRSQIDLDYLCRFDHDLRAEKGNDFAVIDFDPSDNARIYRLGEPAMGRELEVEAQGSQSAPWSRLIVYQGATTGMSIHSDRDRSRSAIPYFPSTDKTTGLWDHLDYHFQTKRRATTTNPYCNPRMGFHTAFYEILEQTDMSVKEVWKHGLLYGHPLGWHFRKCSYTLYTPLPADETPDDAFSSARHWTILLLSPSRFFDENNNSFPVCDVSAGRKQALGHCMGRLTRTGAELNLIGQGLERITERWADFQSFFDYILDGGDSLMQPTQHDNLLFDDSAFSRSRKYFWAIDCLSEFDLCITDNIVQWELYRTARIIPLNGLSELDARQYAFAERQYLILQNQRESFRQKLASIKALRDALFNASAVIESRASTRLGENVKLLTFVSIFFLPLSFTTSLWSVNDHFSMTCLTYIIIIVALATYFVMFNINSLAQGFNQVYDIKKKRIVRAMKWDCKETWKLLGQRFEVFRPKHENPEPSEWYIPLYALMHPMAVLGLRQTTPAEGSLSRTNSEKLPKKKKPPVLASLFCRRRQRVLEEEQPDEPWVIE